MKKREVWTDRGLQNRVADAALFPSLYSPLGLCHVFFDHVFFDHSEIPTSVLGPLPRAPVRC